MLLLFPFNIGTFANKLKGREQEKEQRPFDLILRWAFLFSRLQDFRGCELQRGFFRNTLDSVVTLFSFIVISMLFPCLTFISYVHLIVTASSRKILLQ